MPTLPQGPCEWAFDIFVAVAVLSLAAGLVTESWRVPAFALAAFASAAGLAALVGHGVYEALKRRRR